MINVIPVMGPNGAISAATTGLLQQNVLKFDQPDIHNLLAQTLLVPERDGSGGSGIGYDLGALIDRVEKLEVNYSSIKTDVDNLWVWVNNFHTKLGGEFDPDYIKERSINGDMKYYSYRSDVISYNSTDTPSNNNGYVNVAWILDQIRGGSGIDPWPYGPTDDRKYGPNAKFDPDRFDDMAHGGRSSWNSFVSQNDGYLHPVFGLHSGINAGFISLVSYNNLTALTKY
jgi:hypothetical protein